MKRRDDMTTAVTPERQLARWRVRVWTDFDNTAMTEESRGDRTDNMARFAKAFEAALVNKCANYQPTVRIVKVKRAPQMIFELFVRAEDEEGASMKAHYWISRASQTERSFRRGNARHREQVRLTFPLGKTQVVSA
jgi:hypothetical protein